MYARVATFQTDPAELDQMIGSMREDVESGSAPPGLEDVKGVMSLVDHTSGKSLGIVLFDSEDDMKRGDEVLNEMSPEGSTRRTAVEFYEVAIQRMF